MSLNDGVVMGRFNMTPHTESMVSMQHVQKKRRFHTPSDDGKKPEPKKQPQKQAVLWCHRNRHTHIKKENKKLKTTQYPKPTLPEKPHQNICAPQPSRLSIEVLKVWQKINKYTFSLCFLYW